MEDVHRLLKVLKLSAQIMLGGGETYRVEEPSVYGAILGSEIESFAIPGDLYHRFHRRRITKPLNALIREGSERIHQVNTISVRSEHGITLEEAEERLEKFSML